MNRRTFVSYAGLGSTAIMFPNILIKKPKESLGVALVGLGYYSRDLLAPALQLTKNCHLAGIVTGTAEKIPVWKEKYGIKDKNVYNYDNMHEIANNPEIDVIYIVLPNALHLKYCKVAAEAGKHVWCEKPMAMNGVEANEILAVCNKNKVQLTIGYRMQHEPNTRQIMKWAKSKPFGKIKTVYADAGWRSGGGNSWKLRSELGGGAIYDMGTYPLNAARYVTGEEPLAVTAKHIIDRPDIFFEVDETTEFMLEFPSGAIAHCRTSLGNNWNTLKILCEKGSYGLSPFQSYTDVKGSASDGTMLDEFIENQQARQMDNDARAIMNQLPPMVPGEDGAKDVKIIDAIFASAKYGGARIAL